MNRIELKINDDKSMEVLTPQPLVEGENLTTEISVEIPASWAGSAIRALITTPTGKLVDAVDASVPVGLTNTMLDGKGTLYVEYVAMKDGTEIARTKSPALLPVSAARTIIGDIDPAPLPDLVAEMVAAKGDCDDAADAAVLATERIETTDAEIQAAEGLRVTAEQSRVQVASADHNTAASDHDAVIDLAENLEATYAPRLADVEADIAVNTNKTAVVRKAFITVIDDDCKAEWITNGHAAVLANHPDAKMSLAINPDLIGTSGFLAWCDIDAFKINSQYEFVNHGYGHHEPLTLSLESLQANYALEKDLFTAHGLNNYAYYVYAGKTSPPTVPNQVSNADLKNKLKQIYKCCLGNSDSKNSYIPFDTYEVKRNSAYAGDDTKDYIDFCIKNNAWCVIFGHSWMADQTSAVLDDILTYIDGKVAAGEVEYVTVKDMIDNHKNIIEVGDGIADSEYFFLDKNGAVDFSVQGNSINVLARKILDEMPVVSMSEFNNTSISDYGKNVITIEPISSTKATLFGLPTYGVIMTVRYYNESSLVTTETTRDLYNYQIYIQTSGVMWGRVWQIQKNIWCWYPWEPICAVNCTSSTRPQFSNIGITVFDTTIGKPIWSKTKGTTPHTTWNADTKYYAGNVCTISGWNMLCATSGTSGATVPSISTSVAFADGTVTWVYLYAAATWVDATGATV